MNKIYFITLSFLIQTIFIQGQAQTKPITGFTEQSAQEEQKTELKFDQFLNCDSIGKNIKILSSKPHHLGSPGDKEVAGYILNQYKSWGWDAKIETYKVLFPTPKIRLLEMVSPKNYKRTRFERR
jgi:N-acetylated-alpha-linked acidic dipeptidase